MVSSVGGFNPLTYSAMSGLKQKQAQQQTSGFDLSGVNSSGDASGSAGTSGSGSTSGSAAEDYLRKYMKMTPAERMEENWLRAHKLDQDKLAAMSPEERERTIKQMKDDIEQKLKDQTTQQANVDIVA